MRKAAWFCMVLAGCTVAAGCDQQPAGPTVAGGDARAGKLLIEQYGCGACHEVPGVRTAIGRVGPPLNDFARRVYIAGELPNQPEILVRWIQHPQALVPETTMPDLSVNERQARDMSAYLYKPD